MSIFNSFPLTDTNNPILDGDDNVIILNPVIPTNNTIIFEDEDEDSEWRGEENKRMEEFAKSLQEKGHTCVVILESDPVQVDWCQQNICTNQ